MDFNSLDSALQTLTELINDLIPFAIGIGVLIFIFGLIKYVTAGADEDGRKGARDTIIWGIVVIFVMTAVWGLVNVIDNTLNLDNTAPRELPEVPGR